MHLLTAPRLPGGQRSSGAQITRAIRRTIRSGCRPYCPVNKKNGVCGGTIGTAVPVSGVGPTLAGAGTRFRFASNCVEESPVASTVSVKPLIGVPAVLLKPEIDTLVPGMKLLTAVNVATSFVIENDVMVADGTPVAVPESGVKSTSA